MYLSMQTLQTLLNQPVHQAAETTNAVISRLSVVTSQSTNLLLDHQLGQKPPIPGSKSVSAGLQVQRSAYRAISIKCTLKMRNHGRVHHWHIPQNCQHIWRCVVIYSKAISSHTRGFMSIMVSLELKNIPWPYKARAKTPSVQIS